MHTPSRAHHCPCAWRPSNDNFLRDPYKHQIINRFGSPRNYSVSSFGRPWAVPWNVPFCRPFASRPMELIQVQTMGGPLELPFEQTFLRITVLILVSDHCNYPLSGFSAPRHVFKYRLQRSQKNVPRLSRSHQSINAGRFRDRSNRVKLKYLYYFRSHSSPSYYVSAVMVVVTSLQKCKHLLNRAGDRDYEVVIT